MRVVVLTSETPANIWLVNQLLARHDVAGIVVERRPVAQTARQKRDRRRAMFRRYGAVRTINKLAFNWVRSRLLAASESTIIRESFFPAGVAPAYARPVPTCVVADVNARAALDFIGDRTADVLAVCGTTVLKPDVFTKTPLGAINIHTGITPEYRSADPIFWALYRGEPEKVGVTIHYIDRGIDTGPIVHQEAVPVYADDSLATIYVRCIRRGAELYSQTLLEIENGTVRAERRRGVPDRAFRSIDLGLLQYLVFRQRFRRLVSTRRRGRGGAPGAAATETQQ